MINEFDESMIIEKLIDKVVLILTQSPTTINKKTVYFFTRHMKLRDWLYLQ